MSAAPKTQRNKASVQAFLAQQPPERLADCQRVLALMEAASGQPAEMWGESIVGFGAYAVQSGGRTNEWPVIGFSPRKQELVLYLMDGYAQAADLLAKLGKHRTGSSCLYLKRLADVDEAVLQQLIERGVAALAGRRLR